MIKRMLKRIARWILREKLAHDERLISRLQGYCRPYLPEAAVADGTDQTYKVQMHLDVNNIARLPKGKILTSSAVTMGPNDTFQKTGDKL